MTKHPPPAAVTLERVSKVFARSAVASIRAIDDVSITIAPGSVVGILGPAGAGKSTLIRLIGGLLEPTSGAIHIHGHDLLRARDAALQNVSTALPEMQLPDPQRSVRGALLAARRRHEFAPRELRAHLTRYLQLSQLWEQRDLRIADLSDGMRQALLLACALLRNPTLLLLDEPIQALDPSTSSLLIIGLKNLAHVRGTTVVIATSNPVLAQALCDEVTIIRMGHLIAAQPVYTLLEAHAAEQYEIRLGGLLDPNRQEWFDGMAMTWDDQTTLLSGTIADQAALHGVLARVRDLNIPLLAVNRVPLDLKAVYAALQRN